MTLEMMKELFGVTHVRDNEDEVPNAKPMCVGEEEVLLSQPVTAAVLSEEEEIPVLHGLAVTVPPKEEDVPVLLQGPLVAVSPKEEVPPEEEDVLVPQAPLSWSCRNKGDALSWLMTITPMMKALYCPW
jgi:hypothetical protein